jgi:hypothetical protein
MNDGFEAPAAPALDPESGLRGRALIDHKREQARERIARRVEREELWGVADMPQRGQFVEHIHTGDIYEVLGHKHEGGDRGYVIKVRDTDTGEQRHLVPWMVTTVEPNEE